MAARLITAPTASPISIFEVKEMIRVTDTAEDGVVQLLVDAAVGMLDGRGGLLCRAIMPQVWAETLTMPGPWVLSLPDVDASSLVITLDGVSVPLTAATLEAGDGGPVLSLTGSGSVVQVQYSCALPAAKLRTAKALICLMVDYWYDLRSRGDDETGLPKSIIAMIDLLAWRGV